MADIPDEDLILLDGQCTASTQALVDSAKSRVSMKGNHGLTDEQAEFVQKAVDTAMKDGVLTYKNTRVSYCSMCKRSAGYAKHTRSGRYHRKGDSNHKKPLSFPAIELQKSFITIVNHVSVGGCTECMDKVLPTLRKQLENVRAQLPETLMGHPPKHRKVDLMKCGKCEWSGRETEMGRLRTMMGDGYYYGKCPSCGAENTLFLNHIKHTGEWVVSETE